MQLDNKEIDKKLSVMESSLQKTEKGIMNLFR